MHCCAEDYEAGLEVCVALEVEDMVQDNLERKFKVRRQTVLLLLGCRHYSNMHLDGYVL